jgi:transcriptional regulator with XRE-family HTH domain
MTNKAVQYGRTRLDPERIASVIRERRAALGISLRDLADKSGVASSTIHNLEQGSYKLQLDKFLAILGALDLVPQEVLEIDQRIESPPLTEQEANVARLLRAGDHAALLRLVAEQLDPKEEPS